jgi:mRNA interferase RelE/StbE
MEIRLSKSALRSLARSNKRALIRQKIGELADDPLSMSPNIKRLQGRPGYRLRVQDWRIIFQIEGNILHIEEVEPRGSAYEERI